MIEPGPAPTSLMATDLTSMTSPTSSLRAIASVKSANEIVHESVVFNLGQILEERLTQTPCCYRALISYPSTGIPPVFKGSKTLKVVSSFW